MNIAAAIRDAAADAAAMHLAMLHILEGAKVLVSVPLSFGPATGGVATSKPAQAIAQGQGTASTYRLTRGGETMVSGTINDGVISIDTVRLMPGDIVTVSEVRVSIG